MTSEDNTPPLIDLHSHLLPGVDGGGATQLCSAAALALLSGAARLTPVSIEC